MAEKAELVASLEVSRPVLREAISQLESLGLVKVRRGLGMFVGDRDSLAGCLKLVRTALAITPRDLGQFAELRSALEHHSARRAAEKAVKLDATVECGTPLRVLGMYYLKLPDAFGGDSYNFELSRQRAESVRASLLRTLRLPASRVAAVGYGETEPVASNETPEGRAANRRIDVLIRPAP